MNIVYVTIRKNYRSRSNSETKSSSTTIELNDEESPAKKIKK